MKPRKRSQLPDLIKIKPEELTWPSDWKFQLPDGSIVGAEHFSEFAHTSGSYPFFNETGQRIGTFTNHGTFWPN